MQATEAVDPARAAERLRRILREAGALALSMFGTPIKNWTKGASSPVSEADIAVDKLLRERLGDAEPGFGWLSEETVDDPARLAARYVWIVDPIDGTRGYIAGLPEWAVSAALVDNGRPVVGLPVRSGERRILYRGRRRRRHLQWRGDRGLARSGARRHPHRRAEEFSGKAAGRSRRRPPSCRAFHSLALRLAGSRRARSTPPLRAATVMTGTLRQPIFWCTKRAARSPRLAAGR